MRIREYMTKNVNSWLDFSKSLGLDLDEQDLCFTVGMTKTKNWTVAAFDGNSEHKEAAINVSLGYSGIGAEVGLSMSSSSQTTPNYSYRTNRSSRNYSPSKLPPPGSLLPSPPSSPSPSPSPSISPPPSSSLQQSLPFPESPIPLVHHSSVSSPQVVRPPKQPLPHMNPIQPEDLLPTPPSTLETDFESRELSSAGNVQPSEVDQSIFLRYYKMKRRRILPGSKPIRAAAGPDELPPPGPGESGVHNFTADSVSDSEYDDHDLESVSDVHKVNLTLPSCKGLSPC